MTQIENSIQSKKHDVFTRYKPLINSAIEIVIRNKEKRSLVRNRLIRKLSNRSDRTSFQKYERAWIIKELVNEILRVTPDPNPTQYYSDLIKLNQIDQNQSKENQFWIHFSHLKIRVQIALLLKYRFMVHLSDMASAINIPNESLQFEINQALDSVSSLLDFPSENKSQIFDWIKSSGIRLSAQEEPSADSIIPNWITKNSRWSHTPVFLRNLLEGALIGVSGLILIILVPRLAQFYDRKVEDRLQLYEFSEEQETTSPLLPSEQLAKSESDSDSSGELSQNSSSSSEDIDVIEQNLETLAKEPVAVRSKKITVGHYQMWRFELKTESPESLRSRISEILRELIPDAKPTDLTGAERPGGIQFNLIASREVVKPIMDRIEQLAKELPTNESRIMADEPFRWFQSRAKDRLQRGQTQIVVFLSQI